MKCIWKLFIDGTDTSVMWLDHKPNTRFAIYNAGTATNPNEDLVLDKETGLIWPRHANPLTDAKNWLDANTACREFKLANRIGWRLPAVEELSSLIDTRRSRPALPTGHPFLSVQVGAAAWAYWTSTSLEDTPHAAWFVNLDAGAAGPGDKVSTPPVLGYVWPVRGGVNPA